MVTIWGTITAYVLGPLHLARSPDRITSGSSPFPYESSMCATTDVTAVSVIPASFHSMRNLGIVEQKYGVRSTLLRNEDALGA